MLGSRLARWRRGVPSWVGQQYGSAVATMNDFQWAWWPVVLLFGAVVGFFAALWLVALSLIRDVMKLRGSDKNKKEGP